MTPEKAIRNALGKLVRAVSSGGDVPDALEQAREALRQVPPYPYTEQWRMEELGTRRY